MCRVKYFHFHYLPQLLNNSICCTTTHPDYFLCSCPPQLHLSMSLGGGGPQRSWLHLRVGSHSIKKTQQCASKLLFKKRCRINTVSQSTILLCFKVSYFLTALAKIVAPFYVTSYFYFTTLQRGMLYILLLLSHIVYTVVTFHIHIIHE